MWACEIVTKIWDGLISEMDILSAIDSMRDLLDDIPRENKELIRAFNNKLRELYHDNNLSECCGAEIEASEYKEYHDELDGCFYETFYDTYCSECGKQLD